jgi:hypothetical protein
MINPKLALIPSAYKTSKIYTQLPNSSDGDFTFARASTHSRINKQGLIETLTTNVPVLDFNEGCPSFLFGESSTNILTYSEFLSNVLTGGTMSITAAATTAPDGRINASQIVSSASTTTQTKFASVSASASSDYSISVFLKYNGYQWVRLSHDDGTNTEGTYFDLLNGVLGTVESPLDANIEKFNDGWYRCSISLTTVAGATNERIQISLADGNNGSSLLTGDGVTGVYCWGGQIEQKNSATQYIRTVSASAASRALSSMTTSPTVINSQNGTIFLEIAAYANSGTDREIRLSNGSSTDYLSIYFGATDDTIYLKAYMNSVNELTAQSYSIDDVTRFNKIAISYEDAGSDRLKFNIMINGIAQSSSTTLASWSNSKLDTIETVSFIGKIRNLQYYDRALTTSEKTILTQ